MTITFTAEMTTGSAPVYRVTCEDDRELGLFEDGQTAQLEADAHGLACPHLLCQDYGANVDAHYPVGLAPIDMANRNATDVLIALGLTTGDGIIAAGLLLDRIDTALAIGFADAALETVAAGRHVDLGRRVGYVADRLRALRILAEACAAAGLAVIWA